MASKKVCVPIAGVSSNNIQEWQSHLDNFIIHQRPVVALKNLLRLFGDEKHWGLLASMVLLKTSFGNSQRFRHKLSVVEGVLHAEKVAASLYRKLKDHKYECEVQEIFLDCKERLCMIYDAECGCVDCMSLLAILQKAPSFMRPPKLNPHHKHSRAATFLTWTYNQVVLNLDVALLEDEIQAMFVSSSDFFDFPKEMHVEISLLVSCLHFCWLYFILQRYVTMEMEMLQNQIIKTCSALGVPAVTSLAQVNELMSQVDLKNMFSSYHDLEVSEESLHFDPVIKLNRELGATYHLTPQTVSMISSLVPKTLSPFQMDRLKKRLGLGRPREQSPEALAQQLIDLQLSHKRGIETGKQMPEEMDVITSGSFPGTDSQVLTLSQEHPVMEIMGLESSAFGESEELESMLSDEEEINLEISDDEEDNEDLDDYLDEDDKLGEAAGGADLVDSTDDENDEDEEDPPFYSLEKFNQLLYEDHPSQSKRGKRNFKPSRASGYYREDV